MNKGTVIRAGIVFGLFVIALAGAWIASSLKDKNDTAVLEGGSDAYLTVGDYTVTNDELWEKMRLQDGLSYLTQYIERTYFYADEITKVTDEEVDEKIEFYTYGTNDDDVLAEIFEDEDLKLSLEEAFADGLLIINMDPTSDADLRNFVELEIAKEKVTEEYIRNAADDDELAITDSVLKVYYEANTLGDVVALNIKFNSEEEAQAVFNKFDLVPNYNLGWGQYTGTVDIEALSTGDFSEENTTQLDDEGVLDVFIELYNYMNPDKDALVASDLDDFATNNPDMVYSYDEMIDGRVDGDDYITLAEYLFDTLNLEDDNSRYSFDLQTIGEYSMLSFKVSSADVTAFEDLTQTELDDLYEEVLEDVYMTSANVTTVNDMKWVDSEFEIYDPYMKVGYLLSNGETFDNKGSKEYIATVDGEYITAKMLFDYMDSKIGTYYAIDIISTEMLLSSDEFTEMFGDSTDFIDSDNETVSGYRDDLREMKTNFSNGVYAQYGYDNSVFTWEEFLLVAIGATSESEAIQNMFIIAALQPYLTDVADIDYSGAADMIDQRILDYFDLNVTHLLVYTDFDEDLTPDEYNDYVDGLSGQDLTDYEALVSQLETLIEDRLDDEWTFAEIVEEFNDSLVDDPDNDWAAAKEYGFHLLQQSLGNLTSTNTDSYDEDFVAATKALYDEYLVVVNTSATEVTEYYDDQLVQSNFGLHYIQATEGTVFEAPSAEYSAEDDTEDLYPTESYGTTVVPNQAQVDLFIEIEVAGLLGEATEKIMPTTVYDAVDTYFGEVFDGYYTSGYYTILISEYILENGGTYTVDNAGKTAYLNDLVEVLYTSTFPEDYNLTD